MLSHELRCAMAESNTLPPGDYRARKGDYVAVWILAHDGSPECWSLRRAVKVSREGKVTHVTTERSWGFGNRTANGSTELVYNFVWRVLTLGDYARCPELAELADGGVHGGGYPSTKALVGVIQARARVRFPRTKGQKSEYDLLYDAIVFGTKKALEGYRPKPRAPLPPKPSKGKGK